MDRPPAFLPCRALIASALACALAACGGDGAGTPPPATPAAEAPTAAPPPAAPADDAPRPPADAPGTNPPPATDTPPPDGDDPPPPAGADLPSRTTARSSADATHTGPDVPIQRALRVGVQPGADRLVFEFDGDGLPAWSIEYVDRPVYECGSGEAVRLPGDAWLQVRFMGAQAHTVEGRGTTGPKLQAFDHENLIALARICDFEGEVTWVAAVQRPEGYTPRVLDAPARLVVDIAH